MPGAALREEGKNQTEVQRYLALHGFVNATGTIGVWDHIDYTKLGI